MLEDYPARKVLLCLRYGIGDLVMQRPVLEALREALPDSHITAIGAEPAIELLEGDPVVDAVVSIQSFGISHRWDRGTREARERIARWWSEEGFDLHLDLQHAARAVSEVVWALGVRSLESAEERERRVVQEGGGGVSGIKAAARHGWGLEIPEDTLPRVPLRPEDDAFAAEFLFANDLMGPAPIGISPVASHPLKRWPLERFARTADRLTRHTGRRILLFHGPQVEVAEEMLSRMRHADRVVPVGPVHLKRVAALLARCVAFVGNDTGLMHVAAAVGTATVGVFGPTLPQIYSPPHPNARSLGPREPCPHRNVATLRPPACWMAGRCLIGDHSCIQQVGEDEVLARVTRSLRDRGGLEALQVAR